MKQKTNKQNPKKSQTHSPKPRKSNNQQWNCDERGCVAQLKPHKFAGVSPEILDKDGIRFMGMCTCKANPLPLKHSFY